jgi:hypothetical protein
MPRLSGSKMSLARRCLYWAREDVKCPRQESSEAAKIGTNRHAVIESVVRSYLIKTTETVHELAELWGVDSDTMHVVVLCNLREWLPKHGNCEVPLAYNPTTWQARRSERGEHRDYSWIADDEIPMTLDYADEDNGIVHVWDWKFGQQTGTEGASTNAQLAIGALAMCRLTGATEARVGLAFVDDDGNARFSVATLDAFDLARIANEVREIWERLHNDPQPNPGPWCRASWCPARSICPATSCAIVSTPAEPLSLTISDSEQAARIHTQLGLAEEFLAQVKRALHGFVREHGAVELSDGSRLDVVEVSRETVQATDAVRAALLSEGLDSALDWSTSKAAIERAIKATAPRGTAAKRMRDVMETLQSTGGVKVSSYDKIDVIKQRKEG